MTDDTGLLSAIRQVGGDDVDLPFWQAAREGRFLVHRCGVCQRSYWPASLCTLHGNADMHWVEASGRGEVYTYTIVHHAYTPAMRDKTPFVVAVVKLEEGPFFHTNILDCPPDAVTVGLPVEVAIDPAGEGLTLPKFRPA